MEKHNMKKFKKDNYYHCDTRRYQKILQYKTRVGDRWIDMKDNHNKHFLLYDFEIKRPATKKEITEFKRKEIENSI